MGKKLLLISSNNDVKTRRMQLSNQYDMMQKAIEKELRDLWREFLKKSSRAYPPCRLFLCNVLFCLGRWQTWAVALQDEIDATGASRRCVVLESAEKHGTIEMQVVTNSDR